MLLIKGGEILEPETGRLLRRDVLAGNDGRVASIGEKIETPAGAETIDAAGLLVCPGLIDMHVHLREPGFEHKEDIGSGLEAAAAGGFTAVLAMPNTSPTCDCAAVVRFVLEKAAAAGAARAMVCGSISKGLEGGELAPIGEMVEAGAVAVSDDGRTVMSAELMRLALVYAGRFGIPVISHCLDDMLAGAGVMHRGEVSLRLGLRGIPGSAEDVIVSRDILLAEEAGARLHIAHVSTARAAEMVRRAIERGVRVTAEATPHHLVLTDEAVQGYDTNAKVSPPLRPESDREAVVRGVEDRTIGVIATDHAPHAVEEKAVEFDQAPCGLIGLETALPVLLTELVHSGKLPLATLLKAMTEGPADALGIEGGRLRQGAPADITLIDLNREQTIEPEGFRSRSRNTPFAGRKVKGMAVKTVVGGRVVYSRD